MIFLFQVFYLRNRDFFYKLQHPFKLNISSCYSKHGTLFNLVIIISYDLLSSTEEFQQIETSFLNKIIFTHIFRGVFSLENTAFLGFLTGLFCKIKAMVSWGFFTLIMNKLYLHNKL